MSGSALKPTVRELTADAFSGFGTVLASDAPGFVSLLQYADAPGWQVGINTFAADPVPALHRHLDTDECFVPLGGRPVLVVANPEHPDDLFGFRLTKPVCVAHGIWHVLVSESGTSSVFVCESSRLTSERRMLRESIDVSTAFGPEKEPQLFVDRSGFRR